MLSQAQFDHLGLWALYLGRGTPTIALRSHKWCRMLVNTIAAAHRPDDTNLPGLGYAVSSGLYSLNVDGVHRVAYRWNLGKPEKIDYV